jgi:hypothetical protein
MTPVTSPIAYAGGGAAAFVDRDALRVGLDPHRLEADVVDARRAPDGDQ